MSSPSAQQLIDRAKDLRSARAVLETHWDKLAHYCIPRSEGFASVRTEGSRLPADVYDSTARDSAKVFAAGLMGHLTNPASKWFDLAISNLQLLQQPGVRDWLEDARAEILATFSGSNFYSELHEGNLDLGVFGTSTLYSEDDVETRMRYYAMSPREILFAENARQQVDVVKRQFSHTAQQAFDRWGNKAGKTVLKHIEAKKPDERVSFLHCVAPRAVYDDRRRDRRNLPFYSIWVNETDKVKIDEGGYDEQPYHVGRFSKLTHEPWGYSPAMDVLPDILQANRMMKTLVRAGAKIVDPPVVLPDDGYVLPLNMNPAGVNLRKTALMSGLEIQFLQTGGNVPIGLELLQAVQTAIRRAFFVDMFITLQHEAKEMTAREVIERAAEKLLLLGPALGRLHSELHSPVVHRTLNRLLARGIIPEPPPALSGVDYKVRYRSHLARAQQTVDLQAIMQFADAVGWLAGTVNPEVTDKADADLFVDAIAEHTGVDARLVRDADVVEKMRAQRREREAIEADILRREHIAKTAKDAAGAEKTHAEARAVGSNGKALTNGRAASKP